VRDRRGEEIRKRLWFWGLHFGVSFPFIFWFLGDNTRIWTQSLRLIMHVLYHLSNAHSLLCFSYFLSGVSCSCLGLALDGDPSTSASWVVGITGMNHHTQLGYHFLSPSSHTGVQEGWPTCLGERKTFWWRASQSLPGLLSISVMITSFKHILGAVNMQRCLSEVLARKGPLLFSGDATVFADFSLPVLWLWHEHLVLAVQQERKKKKTPTPACSLLARRLQLGCSRMSIWL
jgi:hypothetical protein